SATSPAAAGRTTQMTAPALKRLMDCLLLAIDRGYVPARGQSVPTARAQRAALYHAGAHAPDARIPSGCAGRVPLLAVMVRCTLGLRCKQHGRVQTIP